MAEVPPLNDSWTLDEILNLMECNTIANDESPAGNLLMANLAQATTPVDPIPSKQIIPNQELDFMKDLGLNSSYFHDMNNFKISDDIVGHEKMHWAPASSIPATSPVNAAILHAPPAYINQSSPANSNWPTFINFLPATHNSNIPTNYPAVNVTATPYETNYNPISYNGAGIHDLPTNVCATSTPVSIKPSRYAFRRRRYASSKRTEPVDIKEVMSYFSLPEVEAAKKMKVGLSKMKNICREFGITRWPYRRIKSAKNLYHNLEEQMKQGGCTGGENEQLSKLGEFVRILETRPDAEYDEEYVRLRQACYMFNFKKRKLMEMRVD